MDNIKCQTSIWDRKAVNLLLSQLVALQPSYKEPGCTGNRLHGWFPNSAKQDLRDAMNLNMDPDNVLIDSAPRYLRRMGSK